MGISTSNPDLMRAILAMDAAWDAASGWVNGGGAAVATAHNSPSSPTPPSSCRETANLSPGLDRGVRLMCTDRVVPNH
jgi:hypothetical protein